MTQIDPISPDLSLLVSISLPGPILGRYVSPVMVYVCPDRESLITVEV